jgi:hypothetical protein
VSKHVVLLGDSIFDNVSYTKGLPDVVTHLRGMLPSGAVATLLAIDGSTTVDLEDQLATVPAGATHAVVSVGGNNALLNADILSLPVSSTRQALQLLGVRASKFEEEYRSAIVGVTRRVPNVAVCTVYNGNLPEEQAASARVALMVFNDAILRVAFQLRLCVIDLRLICADPSDYANPIEPSGTGGAKIAHAIATSLGFVEGGGSRSSVIAG